MTTLRRLHDFFFAPANARLSLDEEAHHRTDTSDWPVAIDYMPQQPVTDEFLRTVRFTDERLDIKVGRGKRARRFNVHKALLCRYSGYFQAACQPITTPFRESAEGIFDLPHDNVDAFELFLGWLYSNNKNPEPYARQIHRGHMGEFNSWMLYPVEAYVIGDKFMSKEFSKYALGKIRQYAQLFSVYDMETIYEEIRADDPLRLFARQWVRWRCSQRPDLWASSYSRDLQRDRHLRQGGCGTRQIPVLDPRHIELDHWYRDCGLIGHECEHLPAERGATSFEFDKKAEEECTFDRLRAKAATFSCKTRAWVLGNTFLAVYSLQIKYGLAALTLGILATGILYRLASGSPD